MLKDISLSSTTLIIESRNCTASPENYRIVVSSTDTPYTELLNVSSIEHDVGGLVAPGSQYTVRVQLIEITSDTVIDERNYTLVNTTTTADHHHYCRCVLTLDFGAHAHRSRGSTHIGESFVTALS